jgi:hypothetical protein
MKANQYHLPEHHPAALPEPVRPFDLPVNAQWLAGTGAGSWFSLQPDAADSVFRISRYSPEGIAECNRTFKVITGTLNPDDSFKFIYPSHCALCTVLQYNQVIELKVYN